MPVRTKGSLVTDAYAQLKTEIRQGRMPAGFQSPEPEVADRLGMSRTPVREALIRLQAEGLIKLIPRRGAHVLPIERADLEDIYEILTALEPEAAARLAERPLTGGDLAPMRLALTAMEQALEANNREDWRVADDQFHQHLLTLQGNSRLRAQVNPLLDQLHRVLMATLHLREHPARATTEHKELLEALEQGNPSGVRRTLRQHRKREAREVLELWDAHKLQSL